MRTLAVLLTCLGSATLMPGQPSGTPRFAKPTAMPGERAEDSYAIYSQLLKSGPIEWRNVSRKQWLIEETTNALPLDAACQPASDVHGIGMNPHDVVKAPEDRQTEWKEVLAD
jgi:hypothetical protein